MTMTMTLGELALVGTSRVGAPSETGTPVDALIDASQQADIAQRVLLIAAALDTYQRAGLVAPRIETRPEPAPIDARPACSVTVAAIVDEMMAGDHLELLPEACDLIDRAGQRLPEALLPSCLDLDEPELRRAVHPVLGERGRWLARQRDRWSWAADAAPGGVEASPSPDTLEDLRRLWDEGAYGPRFDAIAQLRAHQPAVARDWIAEAWTRESPENRLKLLGILQTALGPEDEPWLESVLKDRSLAVRARAGVLLARLPESAFTRRAVARVDPLLAWEPSAGASIWTRVKAIAGGSDSPTGTLRVSPPMAADPAWEQDGIGLKPPKGQGERGYWLARLLAQVHPSYWSRRFDVAPRELVRAAWQSEWGSAVATGWSHAIRLQGDADGEWSTALWDGWATAPIDQDPLAQSTRGEMLTMLLASMPPDAVEQRLADALRQPSPTLPFDIAPALTRFDRRWPDRLASLILDAIARSPNSALLTKASSQLPASHFDRGLTIAEEQARAPTGGAVWQRALDLFITRIRLRQRLFQELAR